MPAGGATQWLTLFVGERRAREIVLMCEPIPRRRARSGGSSTGRCPAAELDAKVDAVVENLARKLPQTTRYAKQHLNFWKDLAWHETINHARDWLALSMATEEPQAAVKKFLEKNDGELVLTERDGPFALVTMNRPERLNALNDELIGLVVDALEEADRDEDVRCIVLAGGEKAFAAGADIGQMATASAMDMYAPRDRIDAWDRIKDVRTPIVAAVSGYCLGGGNELAMACDLIVSSPTAQFGQPETGVGIIPGAGGTQRLTRAVGKSLAMDVILAGRFLTGAMKRCVPGSSRASPRTGSARRRRSRTRSPSKAPIATRIAKELVDHADETPLAAGVADERKALYLAFASEDASEGLNAFMEKRSRSSKGADGRGRDQPRRRGADDHAQPPRGLQRVQRGAARRARGGARRGARRRRCAPS